MRSTAAHCSTRYLSRRTAEDRVDFAQLIEDHEQQVEHLYREHFSALRTLLSEQSDSARVVDAKEYQTYLSANFDFVRQTMDEGVSVLRQALSGDGHRHWALRRRLSWCSVPLCIRRWLGTMPPEPGDVHYSPMDSQYFVSRRFRSAALEQMYREYHMQAFKPRLRIFTLVLVILSWIVWFITVVEDGGEVLIFSGKRDSTAFVSHSHFIVAVTAVILGVLMFSDRLLSPRHGQKLVVFCCLSLNAAFCLPNIIESNITLRGGPAQRDLAATENVTLSENVAGWSGYKLLTYGGLEGAGTHSHQLEHHPRCAARLSLAGQTMRPSPPPP